MYKYIYIDSSAIEAGKHWKILLSKLSSDYTSLPASIAKNHDKRTYQNIDFLQVNSNNHYCYRF